MDRMRTQIPQRKQSNRAGFSMVEILIVIGIIGVIAGLGSVAYVRQVASSKVGTATSIINANLVQARQMAIAMRQTRRVAIDPGELEGFSQGDQSGYRIRPAQIWIEGKVCENFRFEQAAFCSDPREGNTFAITDPNYLPDGIMIADVGGLIIGEDGTAGRILYIEFNQRGQLSKIYFEGDEQSARPKEFPAVIHVTRDNEVFEVDGVLYSYSDYIDEGPPQWDEDDAQERYKVDTIEILWLTGKTRVYDYGIFGVFPNDEPDTNQDN